MRPLRLSLALLLGAAAFPAKQWGAQGSRAGILETVGLTSVRTIEQARKEARAPPLLLPTCLRPLLHRPCRLPTCSTAPVGLVTWQVKQSSKKELDGLRAEIRALQVQ